MSAPISSYSLSAGKSVILQSNGRDTHRVIARTGLTNPLDLYNEPLRGLDNQGTNGFGLSYNKLTETTGYYGISVANEVPGRDEFRIRTTNGVELRVGPTGIYIFGPLVLNTNTGTGTVTVGAGAGYELYEADCASSFVNWSVRQAATMAAPAGMCFFLQARNVDATHTATVTMNGGDTLDGQTSKVFTSDVALLIFYIGSGAWKTFLQGGGGTEAKSIEWQLKGTDANSAGAKVTHWQVPFACTITGWEVANPNASNATTTLDFRRTPDSSYPGSWGASPLNTSPVGLSAAQRNSGGAGDFTTTALSAGDWLRVEIATADATLTDLIAVLKVCVA